MQTIRELHDAADKERVKADSFRKEAEKYQSKANDNMADPAVSQRYINDRQSFEQKASVHDQAAMKFETKATELETQAVELNRQKTEIQTTSQSQIDKLDAEEQMLRG